MTMSATLVTFEQEQDSLQEGLPWRFWTEPQRETAVSYNAAGEPYHRVRRRKDGEPYTPRWQAGEAVFIYHPQSGRIVAWLTLDGPAVWNAEDELFWTDSTVEVHAPDDGPTLAAIGVAGAVQGGRQRLTPSQHGAVVKALRGSPSRKFSQTVEASAARAIARWRTTTHAGERVSA
jgi:hypothetical protein